MFFRMTPMKKLLKEAYKNNRLLIGYNKCSDMLPEGYYVSNRNNWIVWVERGCMTKEFLGALIELVGELPEIGTLYVAGKEGKKNSEDDESLLGIDKNLINNLIKPAYVNDGELFEITNFILIQALANARILQSKTGETTLINNFVTTLISPDAINKDLGEFELTGPRRLNNTHWMSWNSRKCIFMIGERRVDDARTYEADVLKILESVSMTGGVNEDE